MSARIHQQGDNYYYEIDGYDIELNEATYCGFLHRLGEYSMMDLITVEDPRDELKFTHFRYDQPEREFQEMITLSYKIGTFICRDTPFEDIETTFYNLHQFGDRDFDGLLEEGDV